MKVVGVTTIYLWKTEETLYCVSLDCSSVQLAQIEHKLPRVKNPEKYEQRMHGLGNRYGSALVVGVKDIYGKYIEVCASVNTGGRFGSIAIYATEIGEHHVTISIGSEIRLLRYEV